MKIDLEKSKEEFLKYTENYDLEDSNIKRKQLHSLRVMEISRNIAESINLSEEEIKIATLIGLLHDIARFEQYKKYQTYSDLDSIDHGDFGVQILENDLRKYIEIDKYDEIIKTAIRNHNKYQISEKITDTEKLFAKIIRDADKIDIFYEAYAEFYKGREHEVEVSKISEDTIKQFKAFCTIKNIEKAKDEDIINKIIRIIAFIFDINFKISFQILKDEDYINKILDRYKLQDESTRKAIEEIRKIANNYIEQKINQSEYLYKL